MQVHILPTNGNSGARIYLEGNQMFLREKGYGTPLHLYFTSDEEIKGGEWVLILNSSYEVTGARNVKEVTNKYIVMQGNYGVFKEHCRKIVATTNPELWSKTPIEGQNGHFINKPSPKIGTDFIEQYVKSQGSIKGVNLEYQYSERKSFGGVETYNTMVPPELKLNRDGSVIWSLIEEKMYTRDEVSKILEEYQEDCIYNGFISSIHWFDKNYPIN